MEGKGKRRYLRLIHSGYLGGISLFTPHTAPTDSNSCPIAQQYPRFRMLTGPAQQSLPCLDLQRESRMPLMLGRRLGIKPTNRWFFVDVMHCDNRGILVLHVLRQNCCLFDLSVQEASARSMQVFCCGALCLEADFRCLSLH